MFICLTNHQPKTNHMEEEFHSHMPPVMRMVMQSFLPPMGEKAGHPNPPPFEGEPIALDIPFSTGEHPQPPSALTPPPSPNGKAKRKKISAETAKDKAAIYLNIEPEDIVSLIPLRFGGTQILYMAPHSITELPHPDEDGHRVVQKTRMSVMVKESPAQVAAMLRLSAQGT